MPGIGKRRQRTYSLLVRLRPAAIRLLFVLRNASNRVLVIIRLVKLAFGFLRSLRTHSCPVCIVVVSLTTALSCHTEISIVSASLFIRLLILD
jgi:hypothetical protein